MNAERLREELKLCDKLVKAIEHAPIPFKYGGRRDQEAHAAAVASARRSIEVAGAMGEASSFLWTVAESLGIDCHRLRPRAKVIADLRMREVERDVVLARAFDDAAAHARLDKIASRDDGSEPSRYALHEGYGSARPRRPARVEEEDIAQAGASA